MNKIKNWLNQQGLIGKEYYDNVFDKDRIKTISDLEDDFEIWKATAE